MKKILRFVMLVLVAHSVMAQESRHKRVPTYTDTPMVHDPVMAYEDSVYHLYCTGFGIQHMTSRDRKTWTIDPTPVMTVMPQWTHDSVSWAIAVLRLARTARLSDCSARRPCRLLSGTTKGVLFPLVKVVMSGMPLTRALSSMTTTSRG